MDFLTKNELRPCYVTVYKNDTEKRGRLKKDGEVKALFHCWEQTSEVVAPSPMFGGHNGGIISGILGIVEREDGVVGRVKPEDIRFADNVRQECAFRESNDHNPLAHPEAYLDDTMAIVDDMTMAQRVELLKYLERVIEKNRQSV